MAIIREAKFEDYSVIARLQSTNWRKYYRGILTDEFLDKKADQDRSTLWYNRMLFPDKDQRVFVAVVDEKIAGFACIFLNEDKEFGTFLDNLHVSEQVHRSGIGSSLLKRCADCISRHSPDGRMYLWVYESNTDARRLYERMGAQLHETIEKDTVGGQNARVCRYVWQNIEGLLQAA